MKSITESLKIIIEKQKEIGYHMPKILNKPATQEQIKETENRIDVKFNEELIELYLVANGINNDYETPSGLTGIIPIHNFLSLNDAVEYYKNGIDIDEYFTNWETEFSPQKRLFPFLDDGAGNCYWIDLNPSTKNENQIYWTNTFGESPNYLYESLTNFFNIIAEGYENGIFTLDEDNYLDIDYNKFDEMSAKNNSNLDYWNKEK